MFILNSIPISNFHELGCDSEAIQVWLSSGDNLEKQHRIRMYREYPGLVPALSGSDDSLAIDLANAIDSGASPTEAIAATYAVSPVAVAALRGRAPDKLEQWLGDPLYLLLALDAVANIQLPASGKDWDAFTQIARELSFVWPGSLCEYVLQELARRGYSAAIEFLEESTEHWKPGLSSVFIFEEAVSSWSKWVVPHAEGKASSIVADHLRQMPAPEIIQQSLEWRTAQSKRHMAFAANSRNGEEGRWLPLLRETFCFGDIEICSCESPREFFRIDSELGTSFHDDFESCDNGSLHPVISRNIHTEERTLALVHLSADAEGPTFAYANVHHGRDMRYPYQDEADAMEAMRAHLLGASQQAWLDTLIARRDDPAHRATTSATLDPQSELTGSDLDHMLSCIVPEFGHLRARLKDIPSPQ